jgi:hypothetical protein
MISPVGRHATRVVLSLCAAAFLVRAAFLVFVAPTYFGRANVHVEGDTGAWTKSVVNLLDHGTYTADPSHPTAHFGRMPAYSFVIGAFYLATDGNLGRAYPALAWTQMAVDSGCVYLLFRIGMASLANARAAVTLAALYAFYPFIVVWTPVIYSETLAVDTMIASVFFYVRGERPRNAAISGGLAGLSILFRPQILILAALMAGRLVLKRRTPQMLAFVAGVLLVYGPWPLRNLVNHGRPVLTQDISGFKNWAPDVMSFMQYIFSVKAEWEPQFTQMVTGQRVVFPAAAFVLPGDREKLEHAVRLAQTCGSGFTHWRQSTRPPLVGPNCDSEVARLFGELRDNQYRHNRWNAYVKVPLQNLRKAVLKTSLTDQSSTARRLGSYLFLYRTFLILLGATGAVALLARGQDATGVVCLALAYSIVWYLLLSAGTLPQLRNVEIRYLLPADVLLLVPAAAAVAGMVSFRRRST